MPKFLLMKNFLFLLILLFLSKISISQVDTSFYCVMFYNLENLFDPRDDSLRNDDAFTPTGMNHWTFSKFNRKINNLAKVILSVNAWSPPDIIGVAEVENEFVLRQLCYQTGLKRYGYKIVHYDSPDSRGIDVALLYRHKNIKILESRAIPIVFPFEPRSKNRDILYVKALTIQNDTLHLFVNHWTSRYSGYAATIAKRNHYASVVRQWNDSLLMKDSSARIIIMGDLNDYPTDESIIEVLQAQPYTGNGKLSALNNLMHRFSNMKNVGTHKSGEFWGCLDQMIVSKSLLNNSDSLQIVEQKAEIYQADFMMVPDEKYGGVKNNRTYLGPRYLGGFSDHLPIFLRLLRITNRCQSGHLEQ